MTKVPTVGMDTRADQYVLELESTVESEVTSEAVQRPYRLQVYLAIAFFFFLWHILRLFF